MTISPDISQERPRQPLPYPRPTLSGARRRLQEGLPTLSGARRRFLEGLPTLSGAGGRFQEALPTLSGAWRQFQEGSPASGEQRERVPEQQPTVFGGVGTVALGDPVGIQGLSSVFVALTLSCRGRIRYGGLTSPAWLAARRLCVRVRRERPCRPAVELRLPAEPVLLLRAVPARSAALPGLFPAPRSRR